MAKYASKYIGSEGATPSGWSKFGSIAVDTTGTASLPESFTPGISDAYDSSGYVIISDTTTAGLVGRSTGGGQGVAGSNIPTYWVTSAKTDESFLNLAKRLTGSQSLVDASSAKTLLNTNGYWTSWVSSTPNIVTDGLILNLDAGNAASYPGTGTTWTDLSGNGNNATLVNGVGYSSADGGSLVFDGSNDYAKVTTGVNVGLPYTNTVSMWFKQTTTAVKALMETVNTGQFQSSIPYLLVPVYPTYLATYNSGPDYSSQIPVTPTNWNNLTICRTPTTETVYLNGVLKVTRSITTNGNNQQFNIGVGYQGFFNGNIPVVHAYNKVLTDAEVLQNYNALKSRYGL